MVGWLAGTKVAGSGRERDHADRTPAASEVCAARLTVAGTVQLGGIAVAARPDPALLDRGGPPALDLTHVGALSRLDLLGKHPVRIRLLGSPWGIANSSISARGLARRPTPRVAVAVLPALVVERDCVRG
jgi:hypothetical protein